MKKQLLWGMLLFVAGFSSCRKDSFKPVNDESSTGKSTKVNVVQHSYVDLILQTRQPGETYDTYKCVFSGAEVIMMGSPSWNTVLYPTLQNGVPALWGSYAVTQGTNSINSYISGGEDFFLLTVGSTPGINLIAFQKGLDNYSSAVSHWSTGSSGPYPAPSDYIQTSYFDTPISVTGKLIRVTTGSHWALATVDYPLPVVAPATIPSTYAYIKDDLNPNITYVLHGNKGIYESTGSIMNTSTTVSVSAIYTVTSTPGVYHSVGSITRTDGSIFKFDNTEDFR